MKQMNLCKAIVRGLKKNFWELTIIHLLKFEFMPCK